jgi:pimeloyl-ACP methyl ester carboxylesterase
VAAGLAAAGRAVYSLDLRGHGESSRPGDGYDLPTFASDLIAALEGLGLEQVVVAGHSLGANVILEAISSRPGLAAGVCLVEGGLVDARDQFATLEDCQARMALPPVAGMPLPRLSGFLRQSNPGWSELRLAAALAAFDVHADGTVAWRLTKDRYEALLRALWAARAADRWPSLQAPALVVAADTGDPAWTAAKRAAEARLRGAVPDIRVEWLTADHDVHTDRPDRIAELLLEAFPAA